ncbi:hypothetical protein [Pedococcus cremeus]|uniref:hypothetical protein n=1 Tax=Pedococcus cremeus TaxID=587636 RepID=UPI000B87AFD7|nr:hypothetical protein [Pedococcus cremeus]
MDVSSYSPLVDTPSRYLPDVTVAAGQSRTVEVPLTQDAKNVLQVRSGFSQETILSTEVICGEFIQATVAPFDCTSLTTTVTLDNTRRSEATEFTTTVVHGQVVTHTEKTTVAAHGEAALTVSLTQNARNMVTVEAGPRRATVGGRDGVCGTYASDLRASVGDFDCGSLTVPVTLDNSRSSSAEAFFLWVTYLFIDHWVAAEPPQVVVPAHTVRTVEVAIRDNTVTTVMVTSAPESNYPEAVLTTSPKGPVCGTLPSKAKVSLGQLNCVTGTVVVTVDNGHTTLPPRANSFEVSSTEYPRVSRAFHAEVDISVGHVGHVVLPVADLRGGRLRVTELEEQRTVIFEQAVPTECRSGATGGATEQPRAETTQPAAPEPAAGPVEGNLPPLAGTGGPLAMWAALGGALIALGAVAMRASRSRTSGRRR